MTIMFNFIPTSNEVATILNAGILFKSAGVDFEVKIITIF